MRKLGLGPDNKAFWTPSAVEDCAGSVIQYGWIITASHIKHYTGRFQVSRGNPAGQGQTGEAWSRKTCEEWDLPGKRQRWQLSTDKNGVEVWPNTFTWTWDESSQVNLYQQVLKTCRSCATQTGVVNLGRETLSVVSSVADNAGRQFHYRIILWCYSVEWQCRGLSTNAYQCLRTQ